MMRELSIDIETYSSADLGKSGVYVYAESPDFAILLIAYAFDDEEVRVIDMEYESVPDELLSALTDENIIKTAFNANFERTCLNRYFQREMPPEQWHCTMIQASELGLPRSLAECAEVLGLAEQKDTKGKACINYFSKPCKPAKSNGGRTRNLPEHDREKWNVFKEYCRQDVIVEREIKRKLSCFPISEREQHLWEIDQHINDRGIRIDRPMAENAIVYDRQYQAVCLDRISELTGIANGKSVPQMKHWIESRMERSVRSLNKKSVQGILADSDDRLLQKVLALKLAVSKTSTSKYKAMLGGVCGDGRIRGTLQFYGANRTGRWTGKMVQPQNLPQNHLKDLELARQLVCDGDFELFEMLYPVSETLSELIRTALVPSTDRRFIVSDFSAIEARVLAYLAGEKWRTEVFRNGGDIYCASASKMFGVPVVKHGVNGHLRQKGKIAELALGYGGSVGALKSMGALEMGLHEEELPSLVSDWRTANPHITQFWKQCEQAAIRAVQELPQKLDCGIVFYKKSGILFIRLPSGRNLAYVQPQLCKNQFGSTAVSYMGIQGNVWQRIETFGGKLAENIVQGVARDCLAESIIRLENRGFEINFHVHDEVILDVPKGVSSAKEIADIMGEPISWANGLYLKAEAYETDFYKKD